MPGAHGGGVDPHLNDPVVSPLLYITPFLQHCQGLLDHLSLALKAPMTWGSAGRLSCVALL